MGREAPGFDNIAARGECSPTLHCSSGIVGGGQIRDANKIGATMTRPLPTPALGQTPPPLDSAANPGADLRPARSSVPMRRVEIASVSKTFVGTVDEVSRVVPAAPIFEEAFSAFARGTLFATDRGPVAVEDLWPGDRVRTAENSYASLLWRGSTMVVPNGLGQDPIMGSLTRISAEAMGLGRPSPDLILGPRARLIHRSPGVRTLTGAEQAALPARDFIDGVNVIELTPGSAVPVYHLGFGRHLRLVANGLEVESMHPGPLHMTGLRGEMLKLYLSCFPHVTSMEDFGPAMLPRLKRADLDLFGEV